MTIGPSERCKNCDHKYAEHRFDGECRFTVSVREV